MIVNVTQQDIALGRADRETMGCPIEQALRRVVGVPCRVWPDSDDWKWDTRDVTKVATLPDNAARWARRFDMGERVKPFSFRTRNPA